MNRKFHLVLLCLFWSVRTLCAASSPGLEDANAKYAAGDYQGAISAYEAMLRSDGPDASVLYNLGNSHQQLKQFGPAILAYERAKLLSPRDPDLAANLAQARKAATAFEEPAAHPRLSAVLGYLGRNEWSWLVAGAVLFLGALALVTGITGFPRRWMPRAALAGVAVSALTISAGSAALWLRKGEAARGIVLAEKAVVRLSPFATADPVGTPAAGSVVHLGQEKDGFRYIEVPGSSLKGWLADGEVASILPESNAK